MESLCQTSAICKPNKNLVTRENSAEDFPKFLPKLLYRIVGSSNNFRYLFSRNIAYSITRLKTTTDFAAAPSSRLTVINFGSPIY